jgi:hypothetical protein
MIEIPVFEDAKLKCEHNNLVKITLEYNDRYLDDGTHIEIDGCEECENKIRKDYESKNK